MSEQLSVPAWDSWDEDVLTSTNSNTASASHGDSSDNLPHVKPAKVSRYVKRDDKHEAFSSLDTSEMLKFIDENQTKNDAKNEEAQRQKWHKEDGGQWEEYHGKWYWKEWKYQQRWPGPY